MELNKTFCIHSLISEGNCNFHEQNMATTLKYYKLGIISKEFVTVIPSNKGLQEKATDGC